MFESSALNEGGETDIEGYYISVFDVDEVGIVEHDSGDYIPENVDEAWSQFEVTVTYDAGIGNIQQEQAEEKLKFGDEQFMQVDEHSNDRMDKPAEGFVKNDYEVDDEQRATNEEPVNLDFNFGFGLYKGQEVRD